jgi:hypothetical protein
MELRTPVVSVRAHLPGYRWTRVFRNAATRTGVYAGVGLSLALTAWLFAANRFPAFENLALERNVVAAAAFGLIALVPVLRFVRWPGNLLASSLVAWSILTLTYRALCVYFRALADRYSAPQILILGSLIYMILATLSWIGTCIWRARESHVSEENHHLG